MKILILTSSTGGGHNTRARALKAWAEPTHEVALHKPLENGHALYRFGVGLYNSIQKIYPQLHHLYFNYLELAGMCSTQRRILNASRFRRAIREYAPDVVLSVHGTLNHGFFDLVKKENPYVKCVTYCGELYGGYGFSKHWVNPRADLFVGAVGETCEEAAHWGMPRNKILQGGFLLDPRFWQPVQRSKEDLFAQHQLDPKKFTLLLSTSAMGANNHLVFLEAIRRAQLDMQVVAFCRTPHTSDEIQDWNLSHPSVAVRALPFSADMPDWLRAVSAIVARPGTGTTSEAIVSGCPIIHNGVGGIMPQEIITTKFCAKYELAPLVKRADDLADVLKTWMANPQQLEQIRCNMEKVSPPQHPNDIVSALERLL